MIQSFADRDTEQLFHKERNRRFAAIARVALRKLFQMNRAGLLQDLAVPPGNRLEALKGDRAGVHSIRIATSRGPFSVQRKTMRHWSLIRIE